MSGFVVLRVQVLKAQLRILRAERDHPGELPGIMSHECAELKKQLPYARFAPLLDTIARCAARWAEFAVRRDEWTAAGDALDLAASAADRLVYTVPDDQRPGAGRRAPGLDRAPGRVPAPGQAGPGRDAHGRRRRRPAVTPGPGSARGLSRCLRHGPDINRSATGAGYSLCTAAP